MGPERRAASIGEPLVASASAERPSVLVVDDEDVICELFVNLLDSKEFRVTTYGNGETALAAASPGVFDLAVIDKNLPGMSGLDLMQQLKERDPLIEVILITGFASLPTAIEALRLGAFDYVEKPFVNPDLVVEKIRKGLQRRALAVTNQRLLASLQVANRELTQRNLELLEIQRELVAQLRMASVGQLAASLGTEINEPLSIIKSNIYVLDEQIEPCLRLMERLAHQAAVDPSQEALRDLFVEAARSGGLRRVDLFVEDALQAFREIKQELDRLVSLVRGMQIYSQAGRGERRSVDLSGCIERAIELAEKERNRRGIELRVDVEPGLPALRGTPHLLTQAVLSLLQNAFEAIPREGLVEIRARADGDVVRLVVSDTGMGIAREDLGKVMKPFYTTKETELHPGLGLNLAEEIVRRHGGRLRIESDPGVGTRVTATLPAA